MFAYSYVSMWVYLYLCVICRWDNNRFMRMVFFCSVSLFFFISSTIRTYKHRLCRCVYAYACNKKVIYALNEKNEFLPQFFRSLCFLSHFFLPKYKRQKKKKQNNIIFIFTTVTIFFSSWLDYDIVCSINTRRQKRSRCWFFDTDLHFVSTTLTINR